MILGEVTPILDDDEHDRINDQRRETRHGG